MSLMAGGQLSEKLYKDETMTKAIQIGDKYVGTGYSTYIIAEIGINHNGDLDIAKKLIDTAVISGCTAVKFQKRTPELCVPEDQKNLIRETPWGNMTYLDYRYRVEFGEDEYSQIDRYCREKGIHWFASSWDIQSVQFIEQFNPVCHKVSSALLTDDEFLETVKRTGRPFILSTGMSTMEEVQKAVTVLGKKNMLLAHSTSTYPCAPDELNLRMIQTLKQEFGVPVGYSGHEVGLQTTCAAVAIGACFVERHITLDRASWGSDQAASVEPAGLIRLVRDIRVIEQALGDGVKRVYESEMDSKKRLRKTE